MEMFLTAAGKRIYRAPEFNRDVDLTTHVEQRTAPGERMQFADSMAEKDSPPAIKRLMQLSLNGY